MANNVVGRAYHAIDGKETTELIIAEIRRQLSMDSDFGRAHTFRQVRWEWTLNLQGNESSPVTTTIGGTLQQFDPQTNKPFPAQENEGEPIILEVSSSRNIPITIPPDKVREEAGLPVPSPRVTKRGETVDVDMEMIVADRDQAEQQQERVNKIQERPANEAEIIAQIQQETDPKKKSMMAEAAHKQGIVVPVPVRGVVHDARELARDVTENMSASLGLSQDGAIKLDGTPETRFAQE